MGVVFGRRPVVRVLVVGGCVGVGGGYAWETDCGLVVWALVSAADVAGAVGGATGGGAIFSAASCSTIAFCPAHTSARAATMGVMSTGGGGGGGAGAEVALSCAHSCSCCCSCLRS